MIQNQIEIIPLDRHPTNGNHSWQQEVAAVSPPQAQVREEQIKFLVRSLLAILGEDPHRDGLRRTPQRMARMYAELLAGYEMDIDALVNGALFEEPYNEMIVVKHIEFYSLCEHHLLPFFGQAHVAYIPGNQVIGLSKIPRIVEMYARRLQVQERLTQQIADQLEAVLRPRGVAVVLDGTHLCTAMRGVRQGEARMRTSAMRGQFQEDRALRRELMQQLQSTFTV